MAEPDAPTPDEIAKAAGLLANLKTLEEQAAHFNELVQQVNSAEAQCLKELQKQRKAVKEFLRHKNTATVASSNNALADQLEVIRRKLQHLEYQFPKPAHIILRLAIGSCAPVSLKPLKLRLQYKAEYEIFKLRFCLIFIALSAMGAFVYHGRVIDAVYGFLTLYYYCTCVLREHILFVNGSRIRAWWFGHHYLSIILSGLILITPATPTYASFRLPFYIFSLYIGIVQYLQYRYQKSRLYTLVALDRARPMDTVSGDGFFSDSLEREFLLLLPFLAVGQLWQMWNSWFLLSTWKENALREWQIPVAGALFAILGAGNMLSTLWTYLKKKQGYRAQGVRGSRFTNMPGSPPVSPGVVVNGPTAFPFPAPTGAASNVSKSD
ncbi:TMPIT-like protein [Gaertneriomyces semiglobifer]|nr:TMPIT-like protein [Gaertneriomyces semiglobifer]